MKEQKKGKCKISNSKGKMQSSGVTLIALIITIIILLILAVTSVVLVMRWNIIEKTEMAAEGYQGASEKESVGLAYKEWTLNDDENANLTVDGAEDVDGNSTKGWTVKFPSGNVYTVDENGNIREPVRVTVEGEGTVTLTEENVAEYLGKEVKDFKKDSNGGTETKTVGTAETGRTQSVTVSTTYRLYYVDFEGKYGDKGAVYLKADCDGTDCDLPNTDTTSADNPNIKIKDLNPGLYNAKVDAPSVGNDNMKAVTWLLDTRNWESLKEGINETYQDSVKYIVGAPSLEMMMDSYNKYYGLESEGNTPKTGVVEVDKRVKLFYKYPYYNDGSGRYGYGVGPDGSQSWSKGNTSDNSIQPDEDIDTMYCPGIVDCYWLASPSAGGFNYVAVVKYLIDYGYVSNCNWNFSNALCPLVCLESSVPLSLK